VDIGQSDPGAPDQISGYRDDEVVPLDVFQQAWATGNQELVVTRETR